jgi:P4 family phage/plasmid primase-like protien
MLNQNPYLLGVSNGVIELDREEVRLRKAEASDLITFNTNVPWQKPSGLATESWYDYLETFIPDEDLRLVTQIALGHCLIGGNPQHIMLILKGDPRTGKSTMVDAIQTALGDYAASVNQSIFQNHKLNPVLADSLSKRIIMCSEFDEHTALSASMVKRLTGEDKIRAELKGSNARIEGYPQFVPILATNEVPTIKGADKALQNRLYVIPFNITPRKIRREFRQVIKSICGPAILDWLIKGYVEYRKTNELPMSKVVEDETKEFVSELDEIANFLHEALTVNSSVGRPVEWKDKPDWCVKREDMYTHFQRWWEINNFQYNQIPSAITFTKRLRALGIPGTSGKQTVRVPGRGSGRWWFGVKLSQARSIASSNVLAINPQNPGQK